MPGIVTQWCHCFKDCLTWLLLQMGRERDVKRYLATDCTITAKRFITFTCGGYSTPAITVLTLKYSSMGWIQYPNEWVRALHIYESRSVATTRVIILNWHRIEEKKHSGAFTMVKLRHMRCKCTGITHPFSKELRGFTNTVHLRKYHYLDSQGTCFMQGLLSQTDIKLKNKAKDDRKRKYDFVIVAY